MLIAFVLGAAWSGLSAMVTPDHVAYAVHAAVRVGGIKKLLLLRFCRLAHCLDIRTRDGCLHLQ